MRRGRAGPVGVGPRQTGVDRTPPRHGHAPVETPADSTVAVQRWTGPKRGGRLPARPDSGPARTERPRARPPGEAWMTGASQRALALEPGCFRYAYRSGHAARRCDVTRSLKKTMKTITSVARTREGAACSLRTSRIHLQSIAPSSPQSVIVHVGKEHRAPSRLPVKLGHGQGHAQIRLVPGDDVDGLNSNEKFGSDDRRLSSCPPHNEACRGHGLILFRPRVRHCRQQLGNNRFHKTPLASADNMKAPRSTR